MSTRSTCAGIACILALGWTISLCAAPPETAGQAHRYLNDGRTAYRNGRLTQAAEYYATALALFEALNDKTNQGICLTNLGLVHLDLGHYTTAQSYSERAIALRAALGDRRGTARSLNNLGLALSAQGRYGEALAQLQKALDLNQKNGDVQGIAINYRNIGFVSFYNGQYTEALKHYHKALEIIQAHAAEAWSQAERWAVLDSLGAVYKKLGWHEKALHIYLDLLATPASDPKARIYAWNNVGTIYRSLGDPIKAKDYYERALQEAVRLQNKSAQALVLKNLGLVHFLHLGDNRTAAEHLNASLALSQALHDRYEEANTYIYMGEVARRQGHAAAAQAAYRQASALAGPLAFREAQWAALYGMGQLSEAEGDLRGARRYYAEAIATIESARAGLRGELSRTNFLADKIEVYEAMLRTLLAGKDADTDYARVAKAFEYAERSKARVMLDRLSEAAVRIEEGIPPDLRLRREQLLQELARHTAGGDADGQTGAEPKRRPEVERELEALDLRILESNPRYALVQEPKTLALAEAQRQLLGAGDALVVFFTGKHAIFAWLLTEAQARVLKIANPAAVAADVQKYIRQLTNPASTAYLALSYALYDTLLRPILRVAPTNITRLMIIPDGFLHTLPFETLQAESADGHGPRRFLIERYELSYAPSVSTLGVLHHVSRRRETPERALLGMSVTGMYTTYEASAQAKGESDNVWLNQWAALDKLPYADQELLKIRDHVPDTKELYLQGRSVKSVLKHRAVTRFKVVHLATHSVVNEEMPESSFIVLSPDPAQREGALLWLYEIFNLRLDAEMVVLSSCRSGLGKAINGEGIIGFARAFMYAGARSVVTTFWEINDESTPFFMEQFYFHLGRGASAAEALRRAKLKFLSSAHYAHPFYWGAFAITGDAMVRPYPATGWKKWGGIAVGAVLVLLSILIVCRAVGRKVSNRDPVR